MKKLFQLSMLFAAIVISFSGCEKDEKNEEFSIEGSWQMIKEVDVEYENEKLVGTHEDDISGFVYVITLNDGRWLASELDDDGTLQYAREGTYVRSGDKLTVSEIDDLDADVYTIKTVTGNTLVLWSEFISVEDGVTYKETSEETFKRK